MDSENYTVELIRHDIVKNHLQVNALIQVNIYIYICIYVNISVTGIILTLNLLVIK